MRNIPFDQHTSLSRGIDSVHWIPPGDRLEVGHRRADGKREVLSAARRDSHVLSEDRCPLFRRHCDEVNAASASLTDDRGAMCGFNILHPIRFWAEH